MLSNSWPCRYRGKEQFSLSQSELGISFSCFKSFPGFNFKKLQGLPQELSLTKSLDALISVPWEKEQFESMSQRALPRGHVLALTNSQFHLYFSSKRKQWGHTGGHHTGNPTHPKERCCLDMRLARFPTGCRFIFQDTTAPEISVFEQLVRAGKCLWSTRTQP